MNCKLCLQPYRLHDSRRLPRVLTQCGHTFCHQCITLNMLHSEEFICNQCHKPNFITPDSTFPLNQTLISLLEASPLGFPEFIREPEMCKKHKKKLQAYCENHQTMLCLTCILTEHKSHKIISIQEVLIDQLKKVNKEKESLQVSHSEIQKSQQFLLKKDQQCDNIIDRLNLDFNEYEFEINLLFKNVLNQLKESEENFITAAKKNIDKSIKEILSTQLLVKQKMDFYNQLSSISKQLNTKSGVQFLKQTNKQIFIQQNCDLKQNFNLSYKKQEIHKDKILNELIKSLQQFLTFQRKKSIIEQDKKMALLQNDKKLNSNQNPKNLQQKIEKFQSKNAKHNNKEQTHSKSININQSPCRIQKKSSSNVSRSGKQPQVLEVNLLQKYEKHVQAKNMKKRTSQSLISKGKSPKIEYEIKRQIQVQRSSSKHMHSESGLHEGSAKKIKLITCSIGSSAKKLSDCEKSVNSSKFSSNKIDDFPLSFLNESNIVGSPERFRNANQTFDADTPVSINSFMESSQCTVYQERKDETTILKSSASFTIFCAEQKVYHFGGLKNNTISCQKITSNISSVNLGEIKVSGGLLRSKAQCVIVRDYHPKKCLILGGKDQNGERSSEIFEFDMERNKLQKCQFELSESISGFGTVVYNEKLYVFGGSSFSALKTLHEYKWSKSGFQVKKLSSMINSRDELGFALGFDQFLYVAGGINSSNSVLNSCERYCFKSNKWHSIAPMKHARRSFTLVSLPNGLYAIGGHDGKSYLRTVELYDFETETWVEVSSMNQGRFTHSAVCTGDYQNIIVFGGFENKALKSVEIYNMVENKWSVLKDMEEERFLHCSILVQE